VSASSALAIAEIGNGCDGGSPLRSSGRASGSPFQHPNGNDKPGVGMFPPIGLPDPSAGVIPLAIPPGPGQAIIEGLGTGTPISPPSPAPLGSAIGMFAPPRELKAEEDVTAPDPGTDDSPDSTGKPSARAVSPVLMSVGVVPPASNVLLGLVGLPETLIIRSSELLRRSVTAVEAGARTNAN
jgi:hypothetical protein